MLAGYDDDLAGEVTRTSNRLRGLLTQIHPLWNGSWTHASSTRPYSPSWSDTAPPP